MNDVVALGRSWFSAEAGDEDGVAEIVIYDEIGLWGISASDFHQALRALGPVRQINLRINSPGGEVFDGITIYNMLRRHKARVHVTIDGVAASMASVIAMAGDDVAMPENAMMMIHDPSGVVIGTSKEMRELAAALEKVKASMASAYVTKSGADRDEIDQLMADETWFSADEAVDLGLADRIEDPVQMAAKFDLSARFKRAPQGLSARKKETTMSKNDPNAPAQPGTAAAPAPAPAPVGSAQQPANPPAQQEAPAQPAPVQQQPVAAAPAPAQPADDVQRAVEAERARAADIYAACDLAGRPGDAPAYIAEGKTISEVMSALHAARGSAGGSGSSARSGVPEVSTRHGGHGGQGDDAPLRVDIAANMRRRAGIKG